MIPAWLAIGAFAFVPGPPGLEICNERDDDGDGLIDEGWNLVWYLDVDRDGCAAYDAEPADSGCGDPGSRASRGGDRRDAERLVRHRCDCDDHWRDEPGLFPSPCPPPVDDCDLRPRPPCAALPAPPVASADPRGCDTGGAPPGWAWVALSPLLLRRRPPGTTI